jgi:hypothetical protein
LILGWDTAYADFFMVFLSISKQIAGYCLDLAANNSIPNPFQVIGPAILSCIVRQWQ